MNIFASYLHPLLVHFPIALLSLYSCLELVSWGKLKKMENLKFTKALLATIGGLSLLAAREAGEAAGELVTGSSVRELMEKHEYYANFSAVVFGIIGTAYLLYLVVWLIGPNARFSKPFFVLQSWVIDTPLILLLAFVGLVTIFLTGALGGALVYGPSADPFTSFIYNLVF
jgi:uncharacterized membrane protein